MPCFINPIPIVDILSKNSLDFLKVKSPNKVPVTVGRIHWPRIQAKCPSIKAVGYVVIASGSSGSPYKWQINISRTRPNRIRAAPPEIIRDPMAVYINFCQCHRFCWRYGTDCIDIAVGIRVVAKALCSAWISSYRRSKPRFQCDIPRHSKRVRQTAGQQHSSSIPSCEYVPTVGHRCHRSGFLLYKFTPRMPNRPSGR